MASRLPVELPDSYPLFVRLGTDHRAIVRAHDVDRRLVAVVVADEERKLLTARRPFRLVLDSRAIREHPHSARRKVDDAYFPLFRRVDGAIAENDRSSYGCAIRREIRLEVIPVRFVEHTDPPSPDLGAETTTDNPPTTSKNDSV